MTELLIMVEDPRAEDILQLLEAHLAFARAVTPPEDVHALDLSGLLDPAVTFFAARSGGELVGVGALKRLSADHGELKSMHTNAAFRGQGVGRAMVEHLLTFAAAQGFERVSLETGTMDAFTPARLLYARLGFETCTAFGNYTDHAGSTCMTILIQPD